jgi:aarF domain-containing kinase
MLRAVGAGAGSQMLHKSGGGTGGGFNSSSLSLLKVWIALETRQWVTSSIDDIENLVKYDLLSPNV